MDDRGWRVRWDGEGAGTSADGWISLLEHHRHPSGLLPKMGTLPRPVGAQTGPRGSLRLVTKPSRRAPFVIGDHEVLAGTKHEIELRVARLPPGMWTGVPLSVIHGKRPGPTMWVSGALHGDELNGVPIVRTLIGATDPRTLSGTLLAVPIINVFGVTIGSRYLPDRRDLNRSFPGSPRGSLASRLAHTFFENVVLRCELGIDFHTGSGGRANLPQIRCDLDQPETEHYARVFAAPLIKHADQRDGALRAAAHERGIKVLLFEAGEAGRFDRRAIALGVAGTQRVMAAAGMIEKAPVPADEPSLSTRSSTWIRAGRSGFCVMDARLGDWVGPGQKLGAIIDSMSKKEVSIRAKNGGMVIGLLRTAMVHQGDGVVHVAEVQGARADAR